MKQRTKLKIYNKNNLLRNPSKKHKENPTLLKNLKNKNVRVVAKVQIKFKTKVVKIYLLMKNQSL